MTLHVCGDVTKIFDDLLKLKGVNILSHAFAGTLENIRLISREKLESSGKMLGFGCIDVSSERVESVEEVTSLIKRGIDLVGADNMIVHPDCGMHALPRSVAREKLAIMCKAVRLLNKETK